jgi:3-hydroxyacyl-[acyl-carrier-protein] dehydratase
MSRRVQDPASELEAVHAAIPHRAPFLFVDRIVERGEARIVTEWRVAEDAPFLRGHYPGAPVVPGVLLCESAIQTGAILCGSEGAPPGTVPVLTKIGDARFKRMVRPGELVRNEVTLEERVGAARYLTARITCDGQSVARIEFVVTFAAGAS